ncbi:S9 family peptidase [Phenylobacterium aquaticum]|uniref:S9 family peptidase n=1 Tax=Phenylobacterium aquaticum TaxID=1763816 RepID=UPI0026ECCC5F|nr:S9 family peptidase [Phenylobacterium aquaticum]
MSVRHHLTAGAALAIFLAAPALAAAPAKPVPSPATGLTDPRSLVSLVNPQAGPVAAADLYFSRGGLDAIWTADGKAAIVSTNLTGRFNLWRVEADGSWPVQLTQSDDRQSGLAASPDGKWIVFQADTGGDEMYDLYAVPVGGGPVINLTNTPDISETTARFSPDGATLAFAAKRKADAGSNIAVMGWADHKVRLLTQEAQPEFSWAPVGWVAGGLIANRGNLGSTLMGVWRVSLDGGAPAPVTSVKTKAVIAATAVSADGKTLAITSNEATGQNHAGVLDLATGASRWLKPTPWDQTSGDFTPDGKSLAVIDNADGRQSVSLVDVATGAVRGLGLPDGYTDQASEISFTADGRMLLSHEASNSPFDYWVADTRAGTAKPLTHLGLASLDPARLPSAQIVHYAGQDGTVISAVMTVPFNLKRDGTAPAVVIPHGGPTGQTQDRFSRGAIALASRGYVVIQPNVRGSTGYGMAFQMANHKDLGGMDLTDEVYATRFLTATGYVNPKKIGITGGSYGGFMTLMAIGRTPDVWAAAVSQYGIINWFEMMKHEDAALQQYQRSLIGDPVTDKAVYEASSPMTYIRQAKAPLLVLQGENDIRVPVGQAREVVATLKSVGATVDAHYYPAEGHGFVKRENQIDAMQRLIAWLDKYLKDQ